MIKEISLEQLQVKLQEKTSFVLNVVALWCPDCTERQAPNLVGFETLLNDFGLPLFNIVAQKEKRVFISPAHETLINALGGHGFPRTVLFLNGEAVDTDNVEVFTAKGLEDLANKFANTIQSQN